MRRQDLSPQRQKMLVAVEAFPGAFALVPPKVEDRLIAPGTEAGVMAAHEALARLQAITSTLPNTDLITRTLSRREAVQSSAIEGTQADVRDVFEYESTGNADGLPPDVLVTTNYVTALESGLLEVRRHGSAAMDVNLVKRLHHELMRGVEYQDEPGEFRKIQNWIAGLKIYDARFVPPPASHIDELMQDLAKLLDYRPAGNAHMALVTRLAYVHAQFETIHPFRDGNGRVGRLLLPLILEAEGYPPLYLAGFLKSRQKDYYDSLLAVQTQGDWTAWIAFLADAVVNSCHESELLAKALVELKGSWDTRLQDTRKDSSTRRIVELLMENPVITANKASERLGVSFVAANNALQVLVGRGILRAPEAARNRSFVASEIISILDRKFGDKYTAQDDSEPQANVGTRRARP